MEHTEDEFDKLLDASKDVVKIITPNKLKGTIKENFSEQLVLSQLSKVISKIKNVDTDAEAEL